MTGVTWALQTNLLNDGAVRAVWAAAERHGGRVHEAIVVPFQDELGNEAELLALDSEADVIIPYGSTKLSRLAALRNWRGCCYDAATFRADVWNARRDDMLNSDCAHMRVRDAAGHFEGVDEDEPWFIRPLHDLKEFSGTVAPVREIRRWMASPASGNFSFSEDTPIILAPVKVLHSESRWFVVGGEVVDGSYYRQRGRLLPKHVGDPALRAAVQALADRWLPHPCCVMDLADTDDGPRVIEFNSINSSGFYDHDVDGIVGAMTRWARTR